MQQLKVQSTEIHFLVSQVVGLIALDTIAPEVSHPADITLDEGDLGHQISWIVYDLSPATYEIKQNGTVIDSGDWLNTEETFNVSLDGLEQSVWFFEITLCDSSANEVNDEVVVLVTAEVTTSNTTTTSTSTTSTDPSTTASSSTTPTSDTNPTTPENVDSMTIVAVVISGVGVIIIVIVVFFFKRKG